MLKDKISGFIEKIRSVDGISACAVISRDGIVAGRYFDRPLNEPWFGALSATILASAESVANLIRMPVTDSVTIRGSDAVIMVMGAGDKFLVAAVLQKSADPARVHDQLATISRTIGEAM
ncbi:MAG TPA: roadblock/LC7 domain-containing protein [Methanoregulaceae archaeon]|nr:roadblock/LC7 domain-containing protein [Methanoregulaceae archaeon]HPD74549.1 roadblock/LC7 domain-containing protein [Methanoregulaceae archaeon]HRY74822.1 roadblock/LC7 domain-containing protein [Methanoregulaceae archaeon]